MTAPTLTGFTPAITFDENTLNATPQLLDGSVDFQDVEGDFNGGQLTLSGLLAEDRASVRNEGVDAGQIGLSGTDVTYGGVVIGTLAGGAGATLTITFNASATSAAIDALIQNLTYANVSNAPTASRNLVLNVTDAAGNGLGVATGASATFAQQTGSNNPFNGVGGNSGVAPTFGDLDGDGDLDMIVGDSGGQLRYFTSANGVFTQQGGSPVSAFNNVYGGWVEPELVDVDGDGDLDLLVNTRGGYGYGYGYGLRVALNTNGSFGDTNSPFEVLNNAYRTGHALADIDGDGDLDLFAYNTNYGQFQFFRNDSGSLSQQNGSGSDPFRNVSLTRGSAFAFTDLDGDGDLDAVVGDQYGALRSFRNDAGTFVELTGSSNPFNGVDIGTRSNPTFADIDNDGDMDLIVGRDSGINYFLNTTVRGVSSTVTVTAQNDALVATGLPTDVAVLEDRLSNVDLSALSLSDPDVVGNITVVLTASAGTLTASNGGGVTISGAATGALTLVGTASAIDAFLNNAANVRYLSVLDAVGQDVATITVTADDGSGVVTIGTVNIDSTDTPEAPVLTGLAATVTFDENTVNATPQLLDVDVSLSDYEDAFTGGALIVSGLLTEDRLSVNNEGAGTGQIGLSGTDVTYEGVVIGTLAGGQGNTLTITFNAAANSVAIDALIQNLTYANVSNAPTAARNLTVTIRDADALTSVTPISVNVTAQNDVATITGVPTDLSAVEETAINVNLSGVTISDPDVTATLSVILTASSGTLTAVSGGGVTVTGSASGVLTLTGTGSAIDAYLNTVTAVRYTGALDVQGADVATITFGVDEGGGPVTAGVITVDITDTPEPPVLTGFSPTLTFAENTVNATPQIMDADVVFSDFEQNFTGGTLRIAGLLSEDRVSVNNQGTDAGQIGLTGTDVTYGGVVIGTLAGGSGSPLTITFNAAANNAAVDALIQNLTYANVSNTPTATRTLSINVTDAGGLSLGGTSSVGPAAFALQSGAANPFNGIAAGQGNSGPTFFDIDNDGDGDLILGAYNGTFRAFTNASGVFTERTGSANPFSGVDIGYYSRPVFVDFDGDGDLDMVAGQNSSTFRAFRNTNGVFAEVSGGLNPFSGISSNNTTPTFTDIDSDGDQDLVFGGNTSQLRVFTNAGNVFTERTGANNPLNGISENRGAPTFVDLDGDGDRDLVLGTETGTLRTFLNANNVFTEQTGSANPFNGIDVGNRAAPAFSDVDGDGDQDLVIGNSSGTLTYYLNNTPRGQAVTVTVTAQNDALTATGLPTDVTVIEEIASNVNLSALTLTDPDVGVNNTMVLTASEGTLTAVSGGGVTVTGSASGVLTLVGTTAAIDAFLNTVSNIRYTGAADDQGDNTATITVTMDEGAGAYEIGVVNVDITNTTEAPILTGLVTAVTFGENDVNATPALIDAEVNFSDFEGTFSGGSLRMSGLLAEDRVSVRNEGVDPGQIGLSGANVTYGGVVIGTLVGGAGNTLTITFNAAANSAAVDALVQNLTYANVSHTPTATRNLALNITDADGQNIGGTGSVGTATFAQRTGANNPFNDINIGNAGATPALVDVDNDGDLDMVAGSAGGTLRYYSNTNGVFTERSGGANPFSGLGVSSWTQPAFADLDGDGDLDLVVNASRGGYYGGYGLRTFRNNGGSFTELTGGSNPFNGVSTSYRSAPAFADMDGDGDLDFVVSNGGSLRYFRNTAGAFSEQSGAGNPFNGVYFGSNASPTFLDLDGDGDLDVVVGQQNGTLRTFRNNGSSFSELTGSANPFNGFDIGNRSAPEFADVDGDGDMDLVVGGDYTTPAYFLNNSPRGQIVAVTVTAQNDALTATGLPTDVAVIEEIASNVDLSALTLTDLDVTDSLTVVLTASAGILTAVSSGGVTVSGSASGVLTLVGTAAAIDAYLNVVANIRYTGAHDVDGDNAATITVTTNEGSGAVELGVINVDITNTTEAPVLTGFATSLTFAENTVNAAPQLLDIDVEFSDFEDTFDGGSLRMSGLLAEDRISVRNEGTDAGQIGLSGADVTYEGVVIGTLAGGQGNTLTITFNAAANSVAIDALVQNLTYANVSGNPTATRDLALNITDADGQSLAGTGSAGVATFAQQSGASNPLNGVSVSSWANSASGDIDGDGDLDLLITDYRGPVRLFINNGGAFTEQNASSIGLPTSYNTNFPDITLSDVDGDGDVDLVYSTRYAAPVLYRNNGGSFSAVTGAANPFNSLGISQNYRGGVDLADIDGDGDQDLVANNGSGLQYWTNSSGVFTPQSGAANPFNSLSFNSRPSPDFVDLDGDGDLDMVVAPRSAVNGTSLLAYYNTGGVFTAATGAANPFTGISLDGAATSFADLDGDGDADLILTGNNGTIQYYLNTSPRGQIVTVNVTTQADAVIATSVPTDVTVVEDLASNLNLSAIVLTDPDVIGDITVVLTASAGTMVAVSGGGVTVTGSASGVLTLVGTTANIDAFLNTPANIRYTGASNVFGDNAATVTITADGGTGQVTLGVVNVDITGVNDAPTVSGFGPVNTFIENATNAGPQLLDLDVAFSDLENNFNGGVLTLSGLLAEDRVSIRNEGSGAGQIGLSGTDVTYGGVVIGALAGGSGNTLTITFNAAADGVAIDALIQNLTYANVSDNPTTSRNLVLNVTDSDGLGLTGAGRLSSFTQLTGLLNPFNGSPINFANVNSFLDLDGDGDLDLVTGSYNGRLRAFTNTNGAFTELTGAANPFDAIDVGNNSDPAFADLDGDGDQDLVLGNNYGTLRTFMNSAGVFSEATGAANPFDGVDVGNSSTPTFQDVDGDGDMDLIVGNNYGVTNYFQNTTPRPSLSTITVNVAPQNDAPLTVGLPTDVTVAADIASNLDLSAVTLTDVDTATAITVVLTASGGILAAASGAGVTVTGSASGVLTLVGTPSAIDAFLNVASNIQYTGVLNVSGNNAATLTITANDGSGAVTLGVVNIDIASSDDLLEGTAAGETLSGLSGNDILRGRGGNDVLNGGSGIDLADYSTAAAGVSARLNSGSVPTDGDGGVDTLISIENLTGSAFNDTLVGDAGANVLDGGLGADTLLGLAGDDILVGGPGAANTLQGGLGDDTYVVSANDTLIELANEGTDTVRTAYTAYVLKTHFENLTYTGAAAFRGTGNAANNVLTGGAATDVLIGLGGNDTLNGAGGLDLADYSGAAAGVTANLGTGVVSADGDGGVDTLISIENLLGSAFADRLVGGSGVNVLTGGQGDDVLVGAGGNDTLVGGSGVDTADYSGAAAGVDARLGALAARNDGDGGVDSFSSIENLTGSNFDDVLIGDGGANLLNGGLGADILLGGGGNDVLIGGAGAANTLQGGLGDDTYVVSANDTVSEFSGEGTDTVQTIRAFYNLAANIENLTFTGSGDFQGGGNALANVITGGSGNDTLSGGQGDDILNGGDGSGDYVFVSGVAANYVVTDLGGGSYRIVDSVGGRDGSDVTHSVERIRFSDGSVAALSSLAVPAAASLTSIDKAAGPQVLPATVDDDFLPLGKDFGEPQVLPGGDGARTLFEFAPLTGDWMLTLADPFVPTLPGDDRLTDHGHGDWM